MTELLSRIFIRNRQNTDDPAVRGKYGLLSGGVGIAVNLILAAIKLLTGFFTASIAITADGLNNLSDAGSSIVTLVTFRISAKPADRDHPFGHARIEYVASMIVSFLILLVGFEMLVDSGKTLFGFGEAEVPEFTLVAMVLLGISILMKLWLSFFYRKIGKKINSGVLRASAQDSLFDCISTSAVLLSTVIVYFTGFAKVDAIFGLGVSVLILIAGVKILNETKNSILGEAPVAETVRAIRDIVAEHPEALGIHDLLVHNYGPNHFLASLHIEVDGSQDIYELHDVIDNIEREIQQKLDIHCTIHMDPIVTDNETVDALREFLRDTLKSIDPTLAFHDFRTVIGSTHTNLIFDVLLPFESKLTEEQIRKKICEEVQRRRPDVYCVITVDRG